MRSAEQRLPAFIFPSSPEKGRSLFLGYLSGAPVTSISSNKHLSTGFLREAKHLSTGFLREMLS